jgi:hypothetical protein
MPSFFAVAPQAPTHAGQFLDHPLSLSHIPPPLGRDLCPPFCPPICLPLCLPLYPAPLLSQGDAPTGPSIDNMTLRNYNRKEVSPWCSRLLGFDFF